MPDYKEKIKELEDELKKTKYNKATQGHIGLVKAKLAMLKDKQESRIQKKTGQSEHGYAVRKSGDATVLLLGFPSAGKSTLLNKLTDARSEVAAYAFTTLSVIPGVMEYKQAKIQILDVPGIVSGAASGRGRGREVLAVIRNADLVLIVIDVNNPEHYPAILREVWESGIRLNKTKPEVFIKKTSRGGIQIGKTVALDIDDQTIAQILREFKINSANVLIRSPINVDDLIDCIETNKKYLPAITCISKIDLATVEQATRVKEETNADIIVSAETDININTLKELIFHKLNFIRVYMKEPKKEADMNEPMIITIGSTVEDICCKLHKDFIKKFKFSRIWGSSAKFPGQRQMLHHVLQDGDILELHLR
ncbi:GTP-binding protein [Candidatus Woesearchaeota archaeon]|nr:GTP-binding protein [Candidatus Woesearchaeota archaeon]